ncbi:unnamed protein product [Rhizoctonia solani]|uniref:O-methylsterigmatocystin oxidoreductase n=1 Tax=Rhizoctonia solani TaxID=456999 RepID=A0A8H3GMA3_9AGAM|nr:unnamed protein product [Rhizoctonia solani]
MLTYSEIGLAATAVGSSLYLFHQSRTPKRPLPPSPAGSYPLIGHALVLPTEREHLVYNKWCKELKSDIISLTAVGQTMVILNSMEAATELLDRRSRMYSDRPQLLVMSDPDLFDWGNNTGSAPYGPRWKKQRRITHEVLKPSANAHNFAMFEKETYAMLKRLAEGSANFGDEFRRTVSAEILSTVYGYAVEDTNDSLVRDTATAIENFCIAAIPGNFMVNFIPWLKYVPEWVPGTQWKRKLKEWRRLKERVTEGPYNWTKAQIASGSAAPSMIKTYLASIEGNPKIELADEEDHLLWATATLFGGASDTTHAALMSFVFLMVRHPEVQARFPHSTTEDDEYRGYFIPKGSIVMSNIWAMTRDETVYKSPETFNPERFLGDDTPNAPVFGFGRRSCPGNHYAEASLFIMFASMLAVFDMKPKTNPVTGKEDMPEVTVTLNALVSHISPFECSIKPRSNVHKELVDSL